MLIGGIVGSRRLVAFRGRAYEERGVCAGLGAGARAVRRAEELGEFFLFLGGASFAI